MVDSYRKCSQCFDLIRTLVPTSAAEAELYRDQGGFWQEEHTEEDLLSVRRLVSPVVEAAEVDWD